MNAIPTDLHCGFHFLALLYLPPKSEVDVLGTCLWPRVVGRERSGRVASECRTSREERPKAGAQRGNLFLPKTPHLPPKRGSFPEELSLCTNTGASRPLRDQEAQATSILGFPVCYIYSVNIPKEGFKNCDIF